MLDHLDALAEAATQVRVEGSVERSEEAEIERGSDIQRKLELAAKFSGVPSATVSSSRKASQKDRTKQVEKRTGNELPQLRFGHLSRCFERLCESIRPARLWILLDEWSSLPLDLQPILADMLKRVLFACPGVTVKIGAIERRSAFVQRRSASSYIGIELGADTGATLNLDEHLVSPDDHESAVQFYERLIQKHLLTTAEEHNGKWPLTIAELKRQMFEGDAFSWLVRAAEGIPRDAINVLGLAAGYAGKRKIRAAEVQKAARTYYLQDKEKGIIGNRAAGEVWDTLQRDVVFQQRSRTFLLQRTREQMNPAMLDLYDARLIHLLKPGLASSSKPGMVYDGYAVDYGCYVNILREMEMDAAWQASGRPWTFRGDEAFLPDRFDESVIFQYSPAHPHNKQRRGR
jgi:hypothetical protein